MARKISVNPFERYNRQELIPGWNQDKLTNASIAIIGSDWMAAYATIAATALGVGRVRLIDDSYTAKKNSNFLGQDIGDSLKGLEIAKVASNINPLVQVEYLEASLINDGSKYFLEDNDVILELTNNSTSKAIAVEYSKDTGVKCITASSMHNYGKLILVNNSDIASKQMHYYMTNFNNTAQDPVISIFLGSLAVEESRKILMSEDALEKTIYYTPILVERFKPLITSPDFDMQSILDSAVKNNTANTTYKLNSRNALIIGAGALGCGLAPALPHMGLERVYIVDPDVIESTNLNRQVMYDESMVGKYKAEMLARKLKDMGVDAKPIVDRFPLKSEGKLKDVSLMFDCVDNFKARYDMSAYASKNNISLISGGTDYQAGQVAVFVPGMSSCINHQLNLEESVLRAEEHARASCIYAPNPSVVTSNMIISGLMAAEARTILSGLAPLTGILKYGTNLGGRIGYNAITQICDCYKNKNPMVDK